MNGLGAWGFHCIIDAAECSHSAITDRETVYNFTKQLVEDIDMVAYGEPQIVNFGSGNKAGFTLVQLIETSNICAHFVNEHNTFYMDVFSCKEFDPEIVSRLCVKYFGGRITNRVFLIRKA
jgi:S-adenosylmethionine/arginine decarboxylase-like enzyme